MPRHSATLVTLTFAGLLYFSSVQTQVEASPLNANVMGALPIDARRSPVAAGGLSNQITLIDHTLWDPPQTMQLKLGAVERTVNKLPQAQQGGRSYVFRVEGGGWPALGTSGAPVHALAKTGKNDGDDMSAEAKALGKVDQLIQYASVNGRFWLIVPDITVEKARSQLADIVLGITSKTQCAQTVVTAIDLTVAAVKRHVVDQSIEHQDPHPGNVFFNQDLTQAELIDWGDAVDRKIADFKEELTKQNVKVFFNADFEDKCKKMPNP